MVLQVMSQRFLEIAPERKRDGFFLTSANRGGRHPRRDLGTRVEAELVQDATNVAIDGALPQQTAA